MAIKLLAATSKGNTVNEHSSEQVIWINGGWLNMTVIFDLSKGFSKY